MARRIGIGAGIVAGVLGALALGHLAVIEIGREVVTLRTERPDGTWQQTRLWVVDHDGAPWLHSKGDAFAARFAGDPLVELERAGETRRYRARVVPDGPHPEIDRLLRDEYGWADRWVRLLVPCDEAIVLVRLDPAEAGPGA